MCVLKWLVPSHRDILFVLCSYKKALFCCVDTVKVTLESKETISWDLRAGTDAPHPLPWYTCREHAAGLECWGAQSGGCFRYRGLSLLSPFIEWLNYGGKLEIKKKPRLDGETTFQGKLLPLPACFCWLSQWHFHLPSCPNLKLPGILNFTLYHVG